MLLADTELLVHTWKFESAGPEIMANFRISLHRERGATALMLSSALTPKDIYLQELNLFLIRCGAKSAEVAENVFFFV